MRLLIAPVWLILLFGCNATPDHSIQVPALAGALDGSSKAAYEQGRPLLLFAYRDGIRSTEAYADWAAYLNDFKADASAAFYFQRTDAEALKSVLPDIPDATEFSVFLKKGMPAYLYEGLIVEPRVYTAVERVYRKQSLRPVVTGHFRTFSHFLI
jgi:hypothetical protein